MADLTVRPYVKPDRVAPENYEYELPPEKARLNVFAKRLCCMIPAMPAETVAHLDNAFAVVEFLRNHGNENREQLVAFYLGETIDVIKCTYGYINNNEASNGLAVCAREVLRSSLGLPAETWQGKIIFAPGFRHRRDCMLPTPKGGE